MAEKANPLVDELNKILTNTLDYKEWLAKLSRSVSQEATRDKLREFSEVKKKESQELMPIINELGGRVESNERMTDQASVYWVPRPLPDADDMETVLAKLITTEKNVHDSYSSLLEQDDIDSEHENILKKHQQEAEANLKYFQGAQQSLETKPT